jgi:hypothetical protein
MVYSKMEINVQMQTRKFYLGPANENFKILPVMSVPRLIACVIFSVDDVTSGRLENSRALSVDAEHGTCR